ncbi:MAG TPA: PBP1A family penicillin-binding protein [Candidatus Marinimicrobia bacterium]|nr:PBP1A family penicillin-binding protein [Candidatus Neomarinimicrobiota bacterium]
MGRADRHKKILSWKAAILYTVVIYVIGSFAALGILSHSSQDLPSIEQLQNIAPELVTRIYSAEGEVLHELFTQHRIYITMDKIPSTMVAAVIAIEDARFNRHWGLSLRDFSRAVILNILYPRQLQGASTLTQQLARILYDTIGFEKTYSRKIKELLTALQIERMYSKSEIAEMYINHSWMGNGVYGIQAAAKRYFNKTSENLTVDECALLAGIIQNTRRYSPINNPVSAYQRRNLVLYRMMELGYLSREEYALYRNAPIQVQQPDPAPTIAPYFVEQVRRWLQQEGDKLGVDIYRDGLSVYTTLDTRIQAIADSAFQRHLTVQQKILNQRLLANPKTIETIISKDSTISIEQVQAMIRGEIPMEPSLRYSLAVEGALIALEPSTGHILAMIGGRDFNLSQFNRATQAKRQPGSVFKPIVYATAIDNGFPVTTQLLNQPIVVYLDDGKVWRPHNFDFSTGGPTTFREGIRRSLNLVAARVVQELISPKSVVETAQRMHLTTYIPAVDAIALGTAAVIPQEITAAYGIFANHGVWVEPIAVTHIKDRYGNTIASYSPRQEYVFSEEVAYLVTDLLVTNIKSGTGGSASWKYGFRHTAGGKTGTTNDASDAWFVGYTPYMVAGVYVGVDNPAVSLGPNETGAKAALPIWARFMRDAHKAKDWKDCPFERPANVIDAKICKETKLLPAEYCPIETEIFIRGTEPTERCKIHAEIDENREIDRVNF